MDARTCLDNAEEIGVLDEQALEAFAGEHDLDEDELAAFRAELEARGVEFVDTHADESGGVAENEPQRARVTHEASGTTDSLTLVMNRARRYPPLAAS